jgi:hypothetical protein
MNSRDAQVYLLQGDDFFEVYMVEDKAVITRLDAKVKELKGNSETEISRHLLHIVNPAKYPNPNCNG